MLRRKQRKYYLKIRIKTRYTKRQGLYVQKKKKYSYYLASSNNNPFQSPTNEESCKKKKNLFYASHTHTHKAGIGTSLRFITSLSKSTNQQLNTVSFTLGWREK